MRCSTVARNYRALRAPSSLAFTSTCSSVAPTRPALLPQPDSKSFLPVASSVGATANDTQADRVAPLSRHGTRLWRPRVAVNRDIHPKLHLDLSDFSDHPMSLTTTHTLMANGSAPPHATMALKAPPPHFRLADLAPEIKVMIQEHIAGLPAADLCAASRVSQAWNDAVTPHLYASLNVTKDNRETVLHALGLDYLAAAALEARASEDDGNGCAAYAAPGTPRKVALLHHVRSLTIADPQAAVSLAEAMLTYPNLLRGVADITLGAPLFRPLVNSGLAFFGRPRSGKAFVGETLVKHLSPRHVHIYYPPARAGSAAGVLDPVLLPRVMAVLLIDWHPESIDYHGVGSDFPPVLGPISRIHCTPCATGEGDYDADGADDPLATACRAHGTLVRMHLRRSFGQHARDELLEAIAEQADPTDDDDLDPDDVPDAADAKVEYHGVPCIAQVDRDLFLDRTFAHWPVDLDVGEHVSFFA